MFNFNSLNSTPAVANVSKVLSPWNIYKVKFVGASKNTFNSKDDPDKKYEVLKVRFEGEDGYYEESIFYPKDGDDKRPKYTNKDGHEYEGASSFERTMTFISQLCTVLNPEGFKKMQAASSKFKSFDDVVTALIKITDVVKGKETNLKLIGKTNKDGKVISALPKFVAVNKAGEVFPCDNFIGDKLFFSNYEEGRRNEFLNAKPTVVEDNRTTEIINNPTINAVGGSEDYDFDSLLA